MVVTRNSMYGNDVPAPFLDIPVYTLDLDLPPRQRWKHIAADFPDTKPMVMSLINQVLDMVVPGFTQPFVKLIMSGMFTKMSSDELTEEVKGICDVTGTLLWAMVAYNVAYNFMAGCSSGGIMTKGENGKEEMFHYRNLDWHMEETRKTTIKVMYTRGGKKVLEAIHYFGMVGIATGVRQGLSCSFNFRARTNASTSMYTTVQQAWGTALGHRPDATGILREILCSPIPQTLDSTIAKLQHMECAPAYMILCSPNKIAILEKDYTTAKVTTSNQFLACANHDRDMEDWTEQEFEEWSNAQEDCLLTSTMERKKAAEDALHHVEDVEDLKAMTQTWPVLNTLTTFGVIMSPERGTIEWGAWYKERPIPPKGMEVWGGKFTPEP